MIYSFPKLRIVKQFLSGQGEVSFLDEEVEPNCWKNIVNGSYDYCLRVKSRIYQNRFAEKENMVKSIQ